MNNLYSLLCSTCNKFGKYKITRLFYYVLWEMKLIHFGHYIFNLWFYKHPTQKNKDEKQFFSEHFQELKAVYDSLEDDQSRTVFENILKFRVTSDWAYLKKSRAKDNLKTQYFTPEINFSDHEVIVDCGAFTGDSVKRFYKKVPGCRVVAIEPDERNFETLQKLKLEGLIAINCGAWSEDTTLSFTDEGGGTQSGRISNSGNIIIKARSLDHLPECQTATYIKMDIEGAELEALKGAKRILTAPHGRGVRPKLAICLYHKPRDFFEIPLYIKKINPDYKLYIHHHNTYCALETVLYAV